MKLVNNEIRIELHCDIYKKCLKRSIIHKARES